MPSSKGPCRFGQYTVLHRQILEREGLGNEVAILAPASNNAYQGLDSPMRRTLFKAIACGDILLKAQCKVRPYEVKIGETDRVVNEGVEIVGKAIEEHGDIPAALKAAIQKIAAIETPGPRKPLVGIVGEIYVRNNTFANEDVIGAIETFGGEAWMLPITDWIIMPIVSLFYDGSGGQNRRLEVFLNNAVRGRRGLGGIRENVDIQVPPGPPGRDRLVPAQSLLSRVRPGGAA